MTVHHAEPGCGPWAAVAAGALPCAVTPRPRRSQPARLALQKGLLSEQLTLTYDAEDMAGVVSDRDGAPGGTSGPGHPEIAGDSVHHVPAVSSRVTPSPGIAVRRHVALSLYQTFYYSARHAKGPLPDRERALPAETGSGGRI